MAYLSDCLQAIFTGAGIIFYLIYANRRKEPFSVYKLLGVSSFTGLLPDAGILFLHTFFTDGYPMTDGARAVLTNALSILVILLFLELKKNLSKDKVESGKGNTEEIM